MIPAPWLWPEGREAEALAGAAAWLGCATLEGEPIDCPYGQLESRLAITVPALVVLAAASEPGCAIVVKSRGADLELLGPDLRLHRIAAAGLAERLCEALAAPQFAGVDALLAPAGLSPSRLARARHALLRRQLDHRLVEGIVRLRPPPETSLRSELRRAGVLRRSVTFLLAHALHHALWVLSWWMIGCAALDGHFDAGWFAGWSLLLVSQIPFQLLATWTQGALAMAAGSVLKRKLLDAALGLDPQSVRGQGIGTFVGRVIESEAVGSLALSGGILALTALFELAVAAGILGFGAANLPLLLTLLLWTALAILAGWFCLRRRSTWTAARLQLTHDLVEKMVGHRTRLAQAQPASWHEGEDAALDRYLQCSERMDAASTRLGAILPRGWLLVGLFVCGLRLCAGAPSASELAIALGGVLLAFQAMTRLVFGLGDLGGAVISWRQIAPVLASLAARRAQPASMPVVAAGRSAVVPSVTRRTAVSRQPVPLLGAHQLAFTHPNRARPVLTGIDLQIFEGDRILLEGPSGSGKSTLASLLTGLRTPDSGAVLLRGVDQQTLGEETWRRRIAAAPQFHENHVLTETFAFNLLLGRRWPARPKDLDAAETLCRELGLGELLDRMPGGMFEMVGESGWQLSHGERSRLFMARALLQEGELVVLDESFTALDPATRQAALRCALARSRTLLVIAHP